MSLIPGWEEIDRFRQPLTAGERAITKAYSDLAATLEAAGEQLDVYVQPYLENLRPDLVVSRPGGGVLIVEVKDWDLESSNQNRKQHVLADQLTVYRHFLVELCLAEAEMELARQGREGELDGIAAELRKGIRTAAYLHGFDCHEAVELVTDHRVDSVIGLGSESLPVPGKQLAAVPSNLLALFHRRLKAWMFPPFHRADQATRVSLSPQQAEYAADPRLGSWRRVQGPAGSGKSLVLAYKAARYASDGKRALLVCYNKTLTSYLRDLVAKMPFEFDWTSIQIVNFHDLLRRIRLTVEEPAPSPEGISTDEYLETVYPEHVADWLEHHPLPEFRYDTVLIDEGQDFVKAWLSVLGRCCGGGELLIVRDLQQNIYSRDPDGLEDAQYRGLRGQRGFRGRWGKLETSYRMSQLVATAVSNCGSRFQGAAPFESAPERELGFGTPFCRWENIPERSLRDRAVEVVRDLAGQWQDPASHPSDLAVVCYRNDRAFEIVSALAEHGLRPLHVYDRAGKRVPGKLLRFHRGDGRIKVVTGHSFKGFEVYGVIVLVSPGGSYEHNAAWIYTAMRGAIEGVWVLNADSRFDSAIECFERDGPPSVEPHAKRLYS